ncbi:MAG: hypothetical protein ABR521_07550 [Gaiellaceae bacterium]
MNGSRRLSQAISEGDGISLIAAVVDARTARAAEQAGAEGIVVDRPVAGLREATTLPVLWRGEVDPAGADVSAVDAARLSGGEDGLEAAHERLCALGLEPVIEVTDDEQLELALERLDPEIFLLSSRTAGEDEDPLDHVLGLLPDVPAGKLAIAEVPVRDREDVLALERAGIDGVLVDGALVSELVGGLPPEV